MAKFLSRPARKRGSSTKRSTRSGAPTNTRKRTKTGATPTRTRARAGAPPSALPSNGSRSSRSKDSSQTVRGAEMTFRGMPVPPSSLAESVTLDRPCCDVSTGTATTPTSAARSVAIVQPSADELLAWGIDADGRSLVKRNEFGLAHLAVNERKVLGELDLDRARRLKWARAKFHYRHPDRRVAILVTAGVTTVWRLR